jgi:hypothetical protein
MVPRNLISSFLQLIPNLQKWTSAHLQFSAGSEFGSVGPESKNKYIISNPKKSESGSV